jgi:hypothetical protein
MRLLLAPTVVALLLPLQAFAASTPSVEADADRPPVPVVGGEEAPNCAWPGVVRLEIEDGRMRCTGSLVHPRIVATAAHCMFVDEPIVRVRFGEDEDNLTELAEVERCVPNPEFVPADDGQLFENTDFGFCELADPVENVPIIPIAYGCELDEVEQGEPVVLAAFGMTGHQNDDHGTKRFVQGNMGPVEPDGELRYTAVACSGDSGGPLFMPLADGTLRQVGIHSHSAFCEQFAMATTAWQLVPLVEEVTGIDIAPCNTTDGEWSPTGWCGGVPLEPHIGGAGTYEEGCSAGPRSGFLDSCGPSVDSQPDALAPTVTVVEPVDGDEIALGSEELASVSVQVEADDADGWGVANVELVIEDEAGEVLREIRATPPYAWQLQLPEGGYYLRADVHDFAENTSSSAWIAFGVGVPAPPPMDGGDETSTATGPDEPDGTSGAADGPFDQASSSATADAPSDAQTAGGQGCSCRAPTPPAEAPTLLGLLVLLIRRRVRGGKGW